MNAPFVNQGFNPFDDPIDRILAEIALSVQLPPSLHRKANDRYQAVCEYLDESPVFGGHIEHFYSQGSMAIDATISTRGTDDEYDLDAVAQLGGPFRYMSPLATLLALEVTLKDYPVQKVVRQTRCVTLYYADRMHLDVTPALRSYGTLDRQGRISHAKGPAPSADDKFVDMNAYGFAQWYRARTPVEVRLAEAVAALWRIEDSEFAASDVDEIPDQCEFVVKNTATLALQLLKRFRNIRYASHEGRVPPSVMLSCYAGRAAKPGMRLSDMLIRISQAIVADIENASIYGRRLQVANPVCPDDVFTDRWPESIGQQNEFASFLRELIAGIEAARGGKIMADRLMDWMRGTFGDRVVTRAADRVADQLGRAVVTSQQGYSRRGGLLLPTPGLAAATLAKPSVVAARPHTFFGRKLV